jgi:general secretion pathway protein F/type IV pilus assembly protein PilC
MSHFLKDYWWVYLPLIAGIGAYLFYKLRSPSGQIWLQKIYLRVPILRTFVIQAAVGRFCRTMSTLQTGGLTMIDSLRIAREVMGNVVLEEEMRKAEEKIVEGSSLSVEIERSKWIPQMVPRMLAVGEETGKTEEIFNRIADMYESELEKSLDRLMALMQPVILVVMGGIIGTILLAILLPLTDVSTFMM